MKSTKLCDRGSQTLFENRKEVMTTQELADALNVSVATIHSHRKDRKIPFFQIGRQYRYCLKEVLQALKQKANSIKWKKREVGHSPKRKDKLWLA